MKTRELLSLLLCGCLLSACAIGNKFDYRSVSVSTPFKTGDAVIAVAVVDMRPDVLSHEVETSYVGMTRGGYGNPFRVSTKSGAALADDLSAAIAASLRKQGWQARSVTVVPVTSRDAALGAIRSSGASRAVLVTLQGWESDTLVNTELNVNVDLAVVDATGKVLVSAQISDSRDLGGSIMNPVLHARKTVLAEAGRLLGQLLQSPAVAKAL